MNNKNKQPLKTVVRSLSSNLELTLFWCFGLSWFCMVIVWACSKEGSEACQQSAAGTASMTLGFPLLIRHGFKCMNVCVNVRMQLGECVCPNCCIVPSAKSTEEKRDRRPAMVTQCCMSSVCFLFLTFYLCTHLGYWQIKHVKCLSCPQVLSLLSKRPFPLLFGSLSVCFLSFLFHLLKECSLIFFKHIPV